MESVYEQFFAMMYYGRWDFQQAYSLPVGLRKWFMERLIKEKEREKEQVEKAQDKAKGVQRSRWSLKTTASSPYQASTSESTHCAGNFSYQTL